MQVWLPPAAIITVVIAFNTLMIIMFNKRFDHFNKRFDHFNKRFDDLRSQMTREHDVLAGKVDNLTDIVTKHITDYSIHNARRTTPE